MDEEIAAQFRNLGIDVAPVEKEKREFGVEAENVEALMLFLKFRTQWRFEPVGSRLIWIGLDYDAVASTIRMVVTGKKRRRELFEAMREMEGAALPVLNGSSPTKGDEPWR
ncbi:MAG: DUF1799 domain-containing protein [Parvibaculaceae bacterium]|nr:DUF1799 domain-containing protein [Parvibaculaceae bacterium]